MVTTDFTNYHLGDIRDNPIRLNQMCDGLLPEIASCVNFSELNALVSQPTFALLKQLVAEAAPNKLLRANDNVAGVDQETLVDWVEVSGLMAPINRNVYSPHIPVPETFDITMFNAGTANWIMRRLFLGLRLDSRTPLLAIGGGRTMGMNEHEAVQTFFREYDQCPTEGVFINDFVMPTLRVFRFTEANSFLSPATDGDELWDQVFARHPQYLGGTIRIIGNAPNVVQAAGQLRRAARRATNSSFDKYGDQLFMTCDPFQVGPVGDELPAQYQGAASAVGQILRSYLIVAQEAFGILPS